MHQIGHASGHGEDADDSTSMSLAVFILNVLLLFSVWSEHLPGHAFTESTNNPPRVTKEKKGNSISLELH